MRLSIVESNGLSRVALTLGAEFIDLTAALGVAPDNLPRFLGTGDEARSLMMRCVKTTASRSLMNSVRVRSPVMQADKLIGIGMNYRSFVDAAQSIGMAIPSTKIWFLRPSSCINGPHDAVWLPRNAIDLDYEVELAVIIGRQCSRISRAEAPAVIAGFTVANDMTLRQRVPASLVLAKCFGTHTPLGPWIVTPDEVGDPHDLTVKTWVNGDLRQCSSTAEMIASCYELIAELSSACTLNPGDVILTGTPDGCGLFYKPSQWLRSGDVVRMEIERIGVIENQIVDEPVDMPTRRLSLIDAD
jgi:2-keto-4-pentenoate hydratase/2-oxohepta-3-ene-1,7-dioic acid hydratase in catechol pathway